MSKRHQKPDAPEQLTRKERKQEHRRIRHKAKQAMHEAIHDGDDVDALIVPEPHHTHPEDENKVEPKSHATDDPRRRVKHWKQPFWKRRKQFRKERIQAEDNFE